MNKEEIEHIEEIKKMLNFTTNDKETGLQMNGEVCHLLLEYINYLEQKESILDKATEKLKEDIKIYGDFKERKQMCKEQLYENDGKWFHAKEILNIIEGEKK